ncbi:MAG: hypothetical protein ACOCRC_03485 [Halodesulfurarchaeum sp.]
MSSRDDPTIDVSNRRSGWFQLSNDVGSKVPIEPAFSVWNRLLHIHEAPLRNIRKSFWWVRKTFFTKLPSETPAYLVEMNKPEVVQFFGHRHFDPGWEMSYNYHGEVLNLRRVQYVDHERYNWWQVHIRGFLHTGGGIELTAHYETEPTEHPDAHIRLHGLDVEHGMSVIQEIMEDAGLEYEYLEADDRTTL